MPSKVPCYLRTLRREWGLTQKELAGLLPRCRRARISAVERGMKVPNATELIAFGLLFGVAAHKIFPRYADTIEDAVMRAAAVLDRHVRDDLGSLGRRKSEFLRQLARRAADLEDA